MKDQIHSINSKRRNSDTFLVIAVLLCVLGLGLNAYVLSYTVSDYPFAVTWSESGRIFNAYQIYAPLLTGQQYPLPWLDPGRAVLDGLVLLLPGIQLWMWRLWVALLSFVMPLIVSGLMVRQILQSSKANEQGKVNRWIQFILVAYGAIFLFQGPIYSHLLIGVIPVLWFYKPDRPWRNLAVVMLSGLWSGLTRVNWFLMPAITAATLYLLQMPVKEKKLFSYIKLPAIWGLGNALVSIGVYGIVTWLSGMPSILAPIMSYEFMRAKLLPNIGYSLGLIPGITLVSLPLVLLIGAVIWRNPRKFSWVRLLLLGGILAVLGIGSTVVSLRAGGGYDLHNYDTYLFLLLLIVLAFSTGRVAVDYHDNSYAEVKWLIKPHIVCVILLIPLLLLIPGIDQRRQYPTAKGYDVLRKADHLLHEAMADDECEILFIDHRHLKVFDLLTYQPLYAPYEKIELMEMAMARNEDYFQQFTDDIRRQRFDFIFSEVLWPGERLATQYHFWYENNMWAHYVAAIVLDHYEKVFFDREIGVAIYAPIRDISP